MKRTFFLLVVFTIFCQLLYSQPVDLVTAGKVAMQKTAVQTNCTLGTAQVYSDNGQTLLFYFFPLQPAGYIVVSGDYRLPPVIAYSFTASADAEGKWKQWLQTDIHLRMQAISKLPETIITKRKAAWDLFLKDGYKFSGKDVFLVKTNWHQDGPYNLFCPLDPQNGNRSIAGCPAVAMAQIVNYYQTTNGVTFTDEDDYYHNYAGRQYWIDDDYATVDFPSFPMLNAYLDTLGVHYQNSIPPTDNDKAALTFACGVAAIQVFTSSGSGTFGVGQAYDAYQKFNFSGSVLLTEADTNVYTRMAQNVANAMPVHLAVVDSTWSTGHNVVVDGHNSENYFHLNFGWGGSANGWYLLPDEFPYSLTVLEGAIVDIVPNNVGIRNPEINEENLCMLSPNPAADFVKIQLPEQTACELIIIFSDGRTAGKYRCKNGDMLDISHLNRGIYFVHCTAKGKKITEKLIVI